MASALFNAALDMVEQDLSDFLDTVGLDTGHINGRLCFEHEPDAVPAKMVHGARAVLKALLDLLEQ